MGCHSNEIYERYYQKTIKDNNLLVCTIGINITEKRYIYDKQQKNKKIRVRKQTSRATSSK